MHRWPEGELPGRGQPPGPGIGTTLRRVGERPWRLVHPVSKGPSGPMVPVVIFPRPRYGEDQPKGNSKIPKGRAGLSPKSFSRLSVAPHSGEGTSGVVRPRPSQKVDRGQPGATGGKSLGPSCVSLFGSELVHPRVSNSTTERSDETMHFLRKRAGGFDLCERGPFRKRFFNFPRRSTVNPKYWQLPTTEATEPIRSAAFTMDRDTGVRVGFIVSGPSRKREG